MAELIFKIGASACVVWVLGIFSAFLWWMYTDMEEIDNKFSRIARWIGGLIMLVCMVSEIFIYIWVTPHGAS